MGRRAWATISLFLLGLAFNPSPVIYANNIAFAQPPSESAPSMGQAGDMPLPPPPSPPIKPPEEEPFAGKAGGQAMPPAPPLSKEKEHPSKKSIGIKEITKDGDYITINFNNIDLQAFTKFISDLTKRNFIIDDKVLGKVTIVSPTKISKEEAYQVFLSVLEVKGYTVVESDSVSKIIPSREGKQSGVKVVSDKEKIKGAEGFLTMIFHLNNVSPQELSKTITPLISKDGNIISYQPTNALIVTDSSSNIKRLTNIIGILDVTPPKGRGRINVNYLKNADAEEVSKVLTGIISKTPQQQQTAAPAGAKVTGFESGVFVTPDKATNSLVVVASPEDYETLKDVIAKLDIRRRQVYVEAAIMEISLDKQRELGIEFRSMDTASSGNTTSFGGTNFGNIGSASSSGTSGLSDMLGLAVGIVKGTFTYNGTEYLNIGALIRAMQSESGVNILSTPNLLTTDNQKAEIMVGENVPFITGKSQSSSGTTTTTVERKDVGISLKITPQISSDDHVKLEIYQEISALKESTEFDTNEVGPVTTKRSANTTVVVRDKQTVAIAGLIRDDKNTTDYKVPFLGDIPILGWLFKYQTKKDVKTNLMVFLTPHIIREAEEIDKITTEKKEKMESVKKEMEAPDKKKEEPKEEVKKEE